MTVVAAESLDYPVCKAIAEQSIDEWLEEDIELLFARIHRPPWQSDVLVPAVRGHHWAETRSASPTPTRRTPASRSAGCSATASAASPTCPTCCRAAPGRPRFHYLTDPDRRREANAQYYAAVSVIDEMAGRVLDEMADQQAERDTLVVYTSDHGHMNGHHGLHSKGNGTTPQNFLEESSRVPCLLAWPGRIRAGAVHPQPVDHCDLFMTLADAAGCDCAELALTRGRTGRSCLPLLSEPPDVAAAAAREWRDAQVCEYGNARMIRTARYKLIKRYPGPNGHFPDELYDLAEDPDEEHNRHGDSTCAGTVAELASRLEAHFANHEDPARSGLRVADLPIHNPHEPWRVDPAGG